MTFFLEMCGHDGATNCMNFNLETKGKCISNAFQITAKAFIQVA